MRPVQRDVGLVRQQQKPEPRLRPAVEGALAVVHGLAAVKRCARRLDPFDRREEVRPPPVVDLVQQLAHRRDVRRVERLVALRFLWRHRRGRGRRRVVVAVFYVVPAGVISTVHRGDDVLQRFAAMLWQKSQRLRRCAALSAGGMCSIAAQRSELDIWCRSARK